MKRSILALLAVLMLASPAAAQPAQYRAVLDQMVAEGLFDKVEQGDQHAASYFVREFVWRINPGCDRRLPGALLKTRGGTNVDGYAEDAIALNGDQSDLFNVIDMVGGAGARGATLGWDGPKNRREHDIWECPRELPAAAARYIGLKQGVPPVGGVDPQPKPTPVPGPVYTAELKALLDALNGLGVQLNGIAEQQRYANERLAGIEQATKDTAAVASNLVADGSWLAQTLEALRAVPQALNRGVRVRF